MMGNNGCLPGLSLDGHLPRPISLTRLEASHNALRPALVVDVGVASTTSYNGSDDVTLKCISR